jgi:hypothetical protein
MKRYEMSSRGTYYIHPDGALCMFDEVAAELAKHESAIDQLCTARRRIDELKRELAKLRESHPIVITVDVNDESTWPPNGNYMVLAWTTSTDPLLFPAFVVLDVLQNPLPRGSFRIVKWMQVPE